VTIELTSYCPGCDDVVIRPDCGRCMVCGTQVGEQPEEYLNAAELAPRKGLKPRGRSAYRMTTASDGRRRKEE
jgi:hypothetical protein